jgi:hypothetical protein
MLVTSIDPLTAYKVSDDLIVELVNVTATVEDNSTWENGSPLDRRYQRMRTEVLKALHNLIQRRSLDKTAPETFRRDPNRRLSCKKKLK